MGKTVGRYRKISIKIWGDDKFCKLSRPKPNGQTLWFYLLTGPHTIALPCAFQSGEAALAEALEWPLPAFRKVFDEVLDQGMVQADWKTRFVFIPKGLYHNRPESPNVVTGWRTAFDELPDCKLKEHAYEAVMTFLKVEDYTEAFLKAFGEVYRFALPESEHNITEHNRTGTEGDGEEGAGAPHPEMLTLGRFGFVRITAEQHHELRRELGNSTEEYIQRFDGWVAEAPDVKIRGVRRRDRQALPSILNWYRRDRETNGQSTTEQRKVSNTRKNSERLLSRIAEQDGGGLSGGTERRDAPGLFGGVVEGAARAVGAGGPANNS